MKVLVALGVTIFVGGLSALGMAAITSSQEIHKLGIELIATKSLVEKLSVDLTVLNSALSFYQSTLTEALRDQQAIKNDVKVVVGEVSKAVQMAQTRFHNLDTAVSAHRSALTALAQNDDSIIRDMRKVANELEVFLGVAQKRLERVERKLGPLRQIVRVEDGKGFEALDFEACPKTSAQNCEDEERPAKGKPTKK